MKMASKQMQTIELMTAELAVTVVKQHSPAAFICEAVAHAAHRVANRRPF